MPISKSPRFTERTVFEPEFLSKEGLADEIRNQIRYAGYEMGKQIFYVDKEPRT
jgi:hypothetical protein